RQSCHTNSTNVDFNTRNVESDAKLKNSSRGKKFRQITCLELKQHKKGEESIMFCSSTLLCHPFYNKDQLNIVEEITMSM
uniref:Ovule protein n=1 Tax=Romanomermis culicivorax TaxID=13658 RepID=A0A915I898_ROMCU